MKVSILKEKKIDIINLPDIVNGVYWITDYDINGNDTNLIAIEAENDKWKIKNNREVYCIDNNNIMTSNTILSDYQFYKVRNEYTNEVFDIYCSPYKEDYLTYNINDQLNDGISIGGSEKDHIIVNGLNPQEFSLKRINNKVFILENNPNHFIYVNNIRVIKQKRLEVGDVIFINGLRMIYSVGKTDDNTTFATIYINQNGLFTIKLLPLGNSVINGDFTEDKEEYEYPLYDEKDYFHKKPRIFKDIEPLKIKVDSPPSKQDKGSQSILLTIGPMITMSMTSIVSLYSSLTNLYGGKTTWNQALPSIVMCGAMFASVLVWPVITKWYSSRLSKKQEKERQEKYSKYIEEKRTQISNAIKEQSQILCENYPDVKECEQIILTNKDLLWQRRISDEDFLKVNLGNGMYPMKIEITYPEEHFSMLEDNLKDMVSKLANDPKVLFNVPIVFSFIDNYISGLIGQKDVISSYMKRLLIQILAFHSYDNLKIVILTDEDSSYKWDFMKNDPHIFSDDKTIRFFATNNDDYKEICYYLDSIYSSREEKAKNATFNIKDVDQVYLVITDCFKKVRDFDVIKSVLENKDNYGFSLFILSSKIANLPDRCTTFIEMNKNDGELYNSSAYDKRMKFTMDMDSDIDYYGCVRKLANIPIEFSDNSEGILPTKYGFLEMYNVGKIEQFNSLVRWEKSNPMLNLQVPVGIGKSGETINIDLHEKYHGPHGLIAGMTGSGKSEFIITYILSMALNFHPYEVQFILIDYKGGGLAGAFLNNSIGLKLPHLVGTITNLDTNEINRCLSSIESELKRRQALFNKARELSNESTIDIYKYQKLYRDKVVSEPVSHLFIICDEFAELKVQQPEFMDQLISTARIGRSLGVHLILATQKPSGVVDPQIWSNTRFRVCMRVQDKSDSNEVIKCPDAAYLKQTGRFYFQVGFNELFVLGQAAWAGGKYYPQEKVKKIIDSSINVINNVGYVTKTIETKEKEQQVVTTNGEELLNIVKYLDNLAKENNISCHSLWLEKMPDFIRIEDLKTKYNYQKQDYNLNILVGEYDIPSRQEQKLLTVPFSSEGNALIYGASGSGKENFIITLIYSAMLFYTPDEVSFYVIDCGSESLQMFNNCPLVGDVLTASDDDKISNLYKMLAKEIDKRKKLFADYNGDFNTYNSLSGNHINNIVVVINNYESYQEVYEKYDDMLIMLSRDCDKYGIYFVLTVNTPNGVRFKLKQNFGLTYCLQQNNQDDYTTILGNVHKMTPSKIFGRGIIRADDDIYEFQTALATEKDKIPTYIKQFNEKYYELVKTKVKSIPILPEVVSYDDIKYQLGKNNELVIGIDKLTLNTIGINLERNFTTIMSSLDYMLFSKIINPLINQILVLNKYNLVVINAMDVEIDERYTSFYKYYNSNFDKVFDELEEDIKNSKNVFEQNDYNSKILETKKDTYCIIIGIDNFKKRLNSENQARFQDIFNDAKDLKTVSYLIVDTVDKIKKTELESWYRNCVNQNNGIWLGNGINDQFSIKTNQKIEEMKHPVQSEFCFVVSHGKPYYVKYVSSFEIQVK